MWVPTSTFAFRTERICTRVECICTPHPVHMHPTSSAYASQTQCICTPHPVHMHPTPSAYALHMHRRLFWQYFFSVNFEQAPMKLTRTNAYDRGKIVSVPLDTYRSRNKKNDFFCTGFGQFWARYAPKSRQNHRNFHQNHANPKLKMSGCQWSITYFIFSKIHEKLRENG